MLVTWYHVNIKPHWYLTAAKASMYTVMLSIVIVVVCNSDDVEAGKLVDWLIQLRLPC